MSRPGPFSSVQAARNELDALYVESLSPVRLVLENPFEHRLRLGWRIEELNDLMDLVRNDGVEDHDATICLPRGGVFGLFGRATYSFGAPVRS
jgi:hypothetical protein